MAEDFGFQPVKEDFGFKAAGEDFGFQPTQEKTAAQKFEEAPVLERAVKAPTGAFESYGRGAANIISGTLGQGLGSLYGLAKSGGDVDEAVATGQKTAEALHIDPKQGASAYFDDQISKGTQFVRDWLGEQATSAKKYKDLNKQTINTLKDEAANRGIAEGVFDNLILPAILGRALPSLGKKAPPGEVGEPPIAPGPTGAQGELLGEERVQPPSMKTPYNIPTDEVDRLNRELNPPVERREEALRPGRAGEEPRTVSIPGQGELDFDAAKYTEKELPAVREEGTLTRTKPGLQPDLTDQEREALRPKLAEVSPEIARAPKGNPDLTLIRHGDTAENDAGNLRAWNDGPEAQLNEKGKTQAAELGKKHKDDNFNAIYTSDLGRTKETTEGLKGGRDIPTFPTQGLRPWNVGELTGTDAEKAAPILKDHAENQPDKALPGGESFNDFKNRALDTVKKIRDLHKSGEKVAIVTHHRVERLVEAWKKAGMKDDNSIDMKTFQDFKAGTPAGGSKKVALGQKKIGHKQGGAVDPDLLTLGVAKLLKSEGFQKVMERFKGTFNEKEVAKAIAESHDPNSKTTVIFMSPDKFLELAMKREEGRDASERSRVEYYREGKRTPIREGLKSKEGLDTLPELLLSHEISFTPGAAVHSVFGHEGRHRADVFKEQGLDLIPVKVAHNDIAWGMASKVNNLPRKILSENGKFTDFPQPETWKNSPSEYDLDFTNKGKFGQAGAFNPKVFDRDSKEKGFVQTVLDARKQFQGDRRSMKELLSTWAVDKVKDISEPFKAATNVMIDKTMSIMAQNKGPVGELIKWTVDKITDIDRKSGLDTEKDLYGEKYKSTGGLGRPFEHRVRGEEGILTNWKEAHKSKEGRVDLRNMLDKALDNIGRDLSKEDFKNDREHKVYDAVQKGLNSILARVNAAREKIGMKPIERLAGFLPASWEGDYRVHIFDGLNNHIKSFGFKTRFQGSLAVKALKENHPDLTIKDVEHVKVDKTQIGDLSAFEEAIRALGKDDPTSLALQRTMVQLRSSKGFGRHGLQRKGVLGFLGMEKGDVGVRNMERSLEQYARQANRYISNIEKAKVASDLDSIPLKVQDKIPNALDTLREYIDNSRGKDISKEKVISGTLETLSRIAGTGSSFPLKVLRELSSVASLYMLTTPRFVLSQLVQHQNAVAKMVQMLHEGTLDAPLGKLSTKIPLVGKLANAEFLMYKGFGNFLKPDASALEGANWAQKNGHLDSALVAMLEMRLGDLAFERSRIVRDAVSVSFGKLEKNAVRMPTFLAFEYGLREAIKDKSLRYETAANLMDYYMVHYGRTSRPLMYPKLGMLGEAASTFKQYSHNGWGQFFEYLNYAQTKGGSIEPLLAHVGMQIAVGGIKGAVLVTEAAAAISVINAALSGMGSETQIPDLHQLVMDTNLPDWLTFGGLSTALGRDVSSSVNAPNLPQMFSAPAVQFAYTAVKDTGHYLLNKLSGVGTEQDEMKAALSVSPAAMRGYIEELYSTPGEPVPKPGQKMKGNYIRDENEKFWAKWTSTKSLPEARINDLVNTAKQELAQDMNAKVSVLDAIIDRIHEGKELDDSLMAKFVEKGGNPSQLSAAIKQRMVERQLDYADRQIYHKHMTAAETHKLEVMKSLLDEKNKQDQQKETTEDYGFKRTPEERAASPMGLSTSKQASDSTTPEPAYEPQAKRARSQELRENRQLYNRPGITRKEVEQGAAQDKANRLYRQEEMERLMRGKNRLLSM